MPHPHNHKEQAARRAKQNANCKDKQQAKKKRKSDADADNPPEKSDGGNIYLSKIFRYALATQVMLSDQEANKLRDDVLNGKFNEYDDLKQQVRN